MSLWDEVKLIPIVDVAKELDIKIVKEMPSYMIALCPFHGDHLGEGGKPNLTLYKGQNTYHCFVCKAHGTVIDLWAGANKVDANAAVHALASRFGIHDPNEKPPAAQKPAQKQKGPKGKPTKDDWNLDRVQKAHEYLMDPKQKDHLEFLLKIRHLSAEYVAQKRLGLDVVYGKWFYVIPAFDTDGKLLSVRVHNRMNRKDKRMAVGWTTKILYDLTSFQPDNPEMHICEGEGDFWTLEHTLHKNAITTFAGAGSIPIVFKENLHKLGDLTKKTKIVLWPDNDYAGSNWAAEIRMLFPKEAPVFKVYWPKGYPAKEDVSYYIHQ